MQRQRRNEWQKASADLSNSTTSTDGNDRIDDGLERASACESTNAKEDEREEKHQHRGQAKEEEDQLSSGEAQHGDNARSNPVLQQPKRNLELVLAHGAIALFSLREDAQGLVLAYR